MFKKILLGVLVAFLLFGGSIGYSLWKGTQEIHGLTVADAELTGTADGIYAGEYASGPIKVRVNVRVAGGNIAEIDILEHDNGKGKPAEAITQSVVAAQTLQVDAIGGATLSSKIILKAVEAALAGANQ